MGQQEQEQLAELLIGLVPSDGSQIGNQALRQAFLNAASEKGLEVDEQQAEILRQDLIAKGILVKGRGRGGAVKRAVQGGGDFSLNTQTKPEGADQPKATKAPGKKAGQKKKAGDETEIISYRHADKRKNNPEVGMVKPENDADDHADRWCYDPHIDPSLQFDFGRAQVEKLIDDALASGDEAVMRDALEELKHYSAPYLNWTGKAERTTFDVETVSLHVHERIDPASILAAVRKKLKESKGLGTAKAAQPDLFAAPFENLPLRDAIDFYKHERGWANRLIAGDSLLVMNSLIQKESMAGQVQMIYIDPPYGIKYGSNFQPFVNKRDVKDRADEDLTQEPEMIKAFRDTWELGIHSYLTYLRDRLLIAKELLNDSGSVFVQISEENVHYVRNLMDEIFGAENLVSLVTFVKTSAQESETLSNVCDYVVWYGKNKSSIKYRKIWLDKDDQDPGTREYSRVQDEAFQRRLMTREEQDDPSKIAPGLRRYRQDNIVSQRPPGDFPVDFDGVTFRPLTGYWKTGKEGFQRLIKSKRIEVRGRMLSYVRFLDDFPVKPISNFWTDVRFSSRSEDKSYVVQTSERVIERCMLMATEPGDLVVDPTCGSGTSAYVAEKWGRRWITCDTSRVSVTLAKQRLMTASYDYFELKYPHEGLKSGFIYKSVPHVMLKSIANNPEIDEIYDRMHPTIEAALAELNKTVKQHLQEWEVPFDFPGDWLSDARDPFDAFHTARQSMQQRIDKAIAAHSDQEILYDQPEIAKNKLRITGPFTVEAVPFPTVLALDEAEQPQEADMAIARSGESARQHAWRDELLKAGIRGKGGQRLAFADLEALPNSPHLHVTGHLDSGERAVISFGPEHAALEQRQVAQALNEAEKLRPAPKFIIFASFEFDPEAAKDIDETNWPGVTLLKAKMNADLLTDDLKKGRASNQSFWLMGQPDVEVRQKKDGQYVVEVHGFDYFDTKKGELVSGGKGKIAMWLLDTDYDERSLYPSQVFFPMAGKKDGWHKLKKNIRAELNESLLDKFQGTVSLPFEPGDNRKIAVKIVDDRGIESLKIVPLG